MDHGCDLGRQAVRFKPWRPLWTLPFVLDMFFQPEGERNAAALGLGTRRPPFGSAGICFPLTLMGMP
jgi:hypothetical protein